LLYGTGICPVTRMCAASRLPREAPLSIPTRPAFLTCIVFRDTIGWVQCKDPVRRCTDTWCSGISQANVSACRHTTLVPLGTVTPVYEKKSEVRGTSLLDIVSVRVTHNTARRALIPLRTQRNCDVFSESFFYMVCKDLEEHVKIKVCTLQRHCSLGTPRMLDRAHR
jgi:hypothetical protein